MWSRRDLFGFNGLDFIVKGNDPFDYKQKLPEDKQCEELGPAAQVWRTYLDECTLFDHEMVEGWKDGLDGLLVFFSASTV
ncbi:hypothetical protein EDD85DRAFT_836147 [Armillaria nabsnona]|nr:hypothetical protein EDD85DRAFT_836147 [Armillaria nabsnona]